VREDHVATPAKLLRDGIDSKDYYAAIKDDPELHVKLSGSWQVVVGDQDVFCMEA
jgi:hypothetical protein